jgi:hypothetical protein
VRHLELKQQLVFCEKYGIAPNELLLFQIILLTQEDDDPEIAKEYSMMSPCSKGNIREMLIKLQNCGLINKSFKIPEEKGVGIDPHKIPLNKNVVKDYYKCSFDLGKDLFDNYPLSAVVNGVEYKLRRVSKKFDSLEDAYRAYGKAIGWNPDTHQKIIELIKQGISNNYQFTTLCDFIVDKDWLNIEALTTDGILNNSNMKLL